MLAEPSLALGAGTPWNRIQCKCGLARLLERDGFKRVSEAVDIDNAASVPR